MNNVTGGSGRIILYLNYPDCKSPELTRLEDFNKYTYLLRIINLLPSMWGCTDKGHLFQNYYLGKIIQKIMEHHIIKYYHLFEYI